MLFGEEQHVGNTIEDGRAIYPKVYINERFVICRLLFLSARSSWAHRRVATVCKVAGSVKRGGGGAGFESGKRRNAGAAQTEASSIVRSWAADRFPHPDPWRCYEVEHGQH